MKKYKKEVFCGILSTLIVCSLFLPPAYADVINPEDIQIVDFEYLIFRM
jgi:hypothetical protein